MPTKLDEYDLKILKIVQQDNRLSAETISRKVSLSASAVQRRLKRLRKAGVIVADTAIVSPEAIGLNFTAIVEVTLERESPQILSEFKRLMLNTPEVMQCYYVTGDADFIVVAIAEDMKHYDALSRRCFSHNPQVKKFRTNIVVNRVKSESKLPLESSLELFKLGR